MKKWIVILILPFLCACTSKSTFDYELYATALNELILRDDIPVWDDALTNTLFSVEGSYVPSREKEGFYSVRFTIDDVKTTLYDIRLLVADSRLETIEETTCASAGFVTSAHINLVPSLSLDIELSDATNYLGVTLYWLMDTSDIDVKVYFSHVPVQDERKDIYFRFNNFVRIEE